MFVAFRVLSVITDLARVTDQLRRQYSVATGDRSSDHAQHRDGSALPSLCGDAGNRRTGSGLRPHPRERRLRLCKSAQHHRAQHGTAVSAVCRQQRSLSECIRASVCENVSGGLWQCSEHSGWRHDHGQAWNTHHGGSDNLPSINLFVETRIMFFEYAFLKMSLVPSI